MKNIIIFGEMGSGKSTIAEMINKMSKYTIMSLGSKIHSECKLHGHETREEMQQYGQMMRKIFGINVWCDYLYNQTSQICKSIIIDDGRQLNEYDYFTNKEYIPIGVTTNEGIRLQRLQNRVNYTVKKETEQHETEVQARECVKKCKIVIKNNSDLDNLEKQIEIVMKNILNVESSQSSQDDVLFKRVLITQILNPIKAKHLVSYIGKTGYAFSWIKMREDSEKHYKVLFEDNSTAYFRRSELKIIE